MISENANPGDLLEITVPCRPEYVRTIRRALADFAEAIQMPWQAVEEVQVAASEAVTNVIEHAYSHLATVPPLRVRFTSRSVGMLIEIEDQGEGFTLPGGSLPLETCIEREGGMGITLIRTLMDRVNYDSSPSCGTRIRMMKFIHPTEIRQPSVVESRVS